MSFIGPVNVLPSDAAIFQSNRLEAINPNVFLRPHDISVSHSSDDSTAPAIVERLIHLGWELQAELRFADGQLVNVNLTREEGDRLNLQPEQQVFVKPKKAKSFAV